MMNLSKIFKLKPDLSGSQRGMTLFIAVVVMGILLFISFAVVNITLKASLFASSGRDSQYAFYAADSGIECAVYWDSKGSETPGSPISCAENSISSGQPIPGTTTPTLISFGGGDLINLALGKTATQSSTYNSTTGADIAVDGNISGNGGGQITHTNSDVNAWWQVDLGSSKSIGSVVVWNRTDCCASRLSDYWLFISDMPFGSDVAAELESRAGTWSYHQTSAPNPSATISTPGAKGRYVRIQFPGAGVPDPYLSLAELQVFSQPVSDSHSIFYFSMTPGSNFAPCAIVTVDKSGGGTYIKSRGYNTCDTSNPRRMERGIEVTY